jgi:hypothetical protein
MFISEKDKQMYYKDKIILLYQKQEYIKELELATKPLTIIKDFTPLAIEENPKRKYIVGFGLWFGAVGYLLFLILRFKERINNYIK